MTVTDDRPGDEGWGPPRRLTGRQLREQLADDGWLDELIDRAGQSGVQLTGEGGFLPELVKAVLERGLDAELWTLCRSPVDEPRCGRIPVEPAV